MSQEEREKLIEFVKGNDSAYSYAGVNFKFYTNADLRALKKKLERRMRERRGWVAGDDGMHPSLAA